MPKPWNLVGRIDHGGSPFVSSDPSLSHYCKRCEDETRFDTFVGERGGVKVYRRNCQRCGGVVQYGIDRTRLLSHEPLPAAALRFIQETTTDRRR